MATAIDATSTLPNLRTSFNPPRLLLSPVADQLMWIASSVFAQAVLDDQTLIFGPALISPTPHDF
ncbi:hypothetical protein N8T08_010031 [Aspergillus melleus]|uniref:Uncharacterized protein n=1 Tax=Aspergillus melleus TaxID=138277 RepID=A0ACC3ASB5_9EURO|nr:hypothetical protein N8T08_010031 [Aspergillus melleus]